MVKVKIEGEGLMIEKEVDEEIANKIIGIVFGVRRGRGRKPAGEPTARRGRKKSGEAEA